MLLERVDVLRPEATEGREPFVELLERLRPQPVEPALRLDSRLDEASVPEHAQVLRRGRLRQSQLVLDLAHRMLRREEKPENRPPVRLGHDGEGIIHGPYIHYWAYACQGIYTRSAGQSFSPTADNARDATGIRLGGQHTREAAIAEKPAGFDIHSLTPRGL